jgi:hypothetical protein
MVARKKAGRTTGVVLALIVPQSKTIMPIAAPK